MSAAAAPPPVPTQESLGSAGPFDLDKCARLFAECSAAAHDVPVLPFLAACEEVKKLVASLGVILGFASVEITERVAGILARVKDLRLAAAAQGGASAPQSAAAAAAAAPAAARASSSAAAGGAAAAGAGPAEAVGVRETLQWLVEDEASRKGAVERGTSAARHLYRLTWVLDFIARLLTELVDKPDESLKEAATAAYEAHLAPHHSWVMKKTVAAALVMLPAKPVFLKSLVGAEPGEDSPGRIRAFIASFVPLRAGLWALFQNLKLCDGRLE